jgi:AraC-like DNA-binding protein
MYGFSTAQSVTPRDSASLDGEELHHEEMIERETVIALLLSRVTQARFSRVIGQHELIFVSSIEALRKTVFSRRRTTTIICETRDTDGVPVAPLLREISVRLPAIALIGYCPRSAPSADVLALANSGIDELVQEGIDDEGMALKAAYRGSIEACAARRILALVKDDIPPSLRSLARYCLAYPREDHSVVGLARALGVDRKTLLNHASRSRFMPPSTLATWCRLLLAVAMLEATHEPVEHVALALDFASPSAFRNACRRYIGQKPSEWRMDGSLTLVAERFRHAVAEGRLVPFQAAPCIDASSTI